MPDATPAAAPKQPWPQWGHLSNAKKYHLFMDDGRSLCGRWALFGKPDEGPWAGTWSPAQDCVECGRKALERFPMSSKAPSPAPGATAPPQPE